MVRSILSRLPHGYAIRESVLFLFIVIRLTVYYGTVPLSECIIKYLAFLSILAQFSYEYSPNPGYQTNMVSN